MDTTKSVKTRAMVCLWYGRRVTALDALADDAQIKGRTPYELGQVGMSVSDAMGLLVKAQKAELVDPEPRP